MIYNIIEFTVTSLIRAIYDRLKDENCGYADVSEKLRTLWHRTRMRTLSDPNASNETAVRISKQLLDEVIVNKTLTGYLQDHFRWQSGRRKNPEAF